MPIEAALFDVDGTLVDSTYLHTVTWWKALRQYGHRVPMVRVHHAIGLGTAQLLDHLLGPGRDHDADEALDGAHQALYAAQWPFLEPLPGARDLVRQCAQRGWKVVLATSASEREVAVLRGVLDVDDAVTGDVHADAVQAAKPAPDVVEAALERAGTDAAKAVFVGDTPWDVKAARRAGVSCLGVCTGGWAAAELAGSGAARVFRDADDLARRLGELEPPVVAGQG